MCHWLTPVVGLALICAAHLAVVCFSGVPGAAMSSAQQMPFRSSLRKAGFWKSSGCPSEV